MLAVQIESASSHPEKESGTQNPADTGARTERPQAARKKHQRKTVIGGESASPAAGMLETTRAAQMLKQQLSMQRGQMAQRGPPFRGRGMAPTGLFFRPHPAWRDMTRETYIGGVNGSGTRRFKRTATITIVPAGSTASPRMATPDKAMVWTTRSSCGVTTAIVGASCD